MFDRCVFLAIVLIFSVFPSLSYSQSSVEQFKKDYATATQEIEKFRGILNGDDAAMAEQAMKFMIQSGKPNLVKFGQEFGLYSSSAALQKIALTEILNSTKRLRATLSRTGQDSKSVFDYVINRYGAIEQREKLNILMGVKNFSDENECWELDRSSQTGCGLVISGDNQILSYDHLRAELKLSDQGSLVGPVIYYNGAPKGQAHLTIELLEN